MLPLSIKLFSCSSVIMSDNLEDEIFPYEYYQEFDSDKDDNKIERSCNSDQSEQPRFSGLMKLSAKPNSCHELNGNNKKRYCYVQSKVKQFIDSLPPPSTASNRRIYKKYKSLPSELEHIREPSISNDSENQCICKECSYYQKKIEELRDENYLLHRKLDDARIENRCSKCSSYLNEIEELRTEAAMLRKSLDEARIRELLLSDKIEMIKSTDMREMSTSAETGSSQIQSRLNSTPEESTTHPKRRSMRLRRKQSQLHSNSRVSFNVSSDFVRCNSRSQRRRKKKKSSKFYRNFVRLFVSDKCLRNQSSILSDTSMPGTSRDSAYITTET